MMFYSKATGGFYSEAIHGTRLMAVIDPAWVQPLIDGLPDMSVAPPNVEVPNPDCKIPVDAVDVPDADYEALLNGQAAGKIIVADAITGQPMLQDPTPPSFDSLKAIELADFRALREMFLNRVAGIGFAAQQAGDQVTVDAAVSVRQGLLDLPSAPSVQAATDLPTLHAAIKAQYAAVVGAVPDAAKAAFAKVDA